jgi:hypothetical protein
VEEHALLSFKNRTNYAFRCFYPMALVQASAPMEWLANGSGLLPLLAMPEETAGRNGWPYSPGGADRRRGGGDNPSRIAANRSGITVIRSEIAVVRSEIAVVRSGITVVRSGITVIRG